MRPSGWTSSGAPTPPLRGKSGPAGVMGPQVLPPSVDFWITAFTSPASNPQLWVFPHTSLMAAADGP